MTWAALIDRANDAIAEADDVLADAEAKRAALALMDTKLREGHCAGLEGHVRALVAGLGYEWTARYLQGLADDVSDAGVDDAAWRKRRRR